MPPAAAPDPDASGLSPLDILLAVMRAKWDAGDADGAAELARAAAPYLHPRRAPTAERSGRSTKESPPALSDAELLSEIAVLARGSGVAARDADLFDALCDDRARPGTASPGCPSPPDHR